MIEVHFFVCIGKWKDTNNLKILWNTKRFSKIYRRLLSFLSQCKQKKAYFFPYIYAKATKTHTKSKKSMSIFPSHDQWQSLENICHSFLLLHCRRMPRECKYWKLDTVHMTLQINLSSFPRLSILPSSVYGFILPQKHIIYTRMRAGV